MRRFLLLSLVSSGVLGMGVILGAAQQSPSDPDLVYIHVTAMNRDGRLISQIPKQSFKIFEDGAPQDIAYFSEGNFPTSAAVVLDVGNAVKDQLMKMVTSGLRKDIPGGEIVFVEPGNTPVNEAILQAINNLAKHGSSRKLVLLLLTLKNDPGEYPFSKVKDALRENNILFYSTAVPSRPELPYDVGTRNLMKDLAELSGGDFFFPTIASQLEGIYQNIARELRYQYVIGYRPKKAADGEWRKIKVTAEIADGKKVTKIDLRTRQGYYARTAATSTPAKK